MSLMYESLYKIRAVAIDLDGVVYQGNQLIPGADGAVRQLREIGMRVFFVTNNSVKTRKHIAEKLLRLGISTSEEDIFNSAYATAVLLNRLKKNNRSSVMVIGSEDLKEIIRNFGLEIVEAVPAEFLVVGMDQTFSYEKICKALDAVISGAIFIACNKDNTYPAEDGRLLPGCGSIVATVEAVCGRPPDYLVGKPETLLLEILTATTGIKADEIMMVGDTLSSDVEMARRFGCLSALVVKADKFSLEGRLDVSTIVIRSLAELPDYFHNSIG